MRGTTSRAARHSSRGFSLVELMVVIGIIALLIGIALPAFSQAKTAAKVATTTATINAIATGMDTFRADERMGGEYPPSQYTALPRNPHVFGGTTGIAVGGANLAVYALAGADLLGSAGIRDKYGHQESGYEPWADDLSTEDKSWLGLYRMNPMTRAPAESRTSFVDVTKMKFPQNVAVAGTPPQYRMPNWGSGPKDYLESQVFLDSFDQPILYYRARLGNFADVADANLPPSQPRGSYCMWDNMIITTKTPKTYGLDLGAGLRHFEKGLPQGTSQQELLNPVNRDNLRKSFAYTVWNPNVTAKPAAHNAETYILLSAGPDGLFGTEDDVGNFPTNK